MGGMQLPRELLELIFSLVTDSRPAINLRDRVRCLAVCKFWKEVLDPRRFPLQSVKLKPLNSKTKVPCQALESWLCSVKPAVRSFRLVEGGECSSDCPLILGALEALLSLHPKEVLDNLSLDIPDDALQKFWPAIGHFCSLRQLSLTCGSSGIVSSNMLRSLPPQLSDLQVSLADVHIQGAGLLPSLTLLRVAYANELAVNASLPSLRYLLVDDVDTVQLEGEQLQLPQLTALQLMSCSSGTVDFSCTPALQELDHMSPGPSSMPGLSALPDLGILKIFTNPVDLEAATCLLQQAPAELRALHLCLAWRVRGQNNAEVAAELGPILGRLTQLELFVSNSTAFLPHVRNLRALRWLELQGMSAADLAIQDVDHLASGMFSLEELAFSNPMPPGEARDMRLRVLAGSLPEGCMIVQP